MTLQDIEQTVDRAAELLLAAERDRRPTDPVRELIGGADIDLAYRVQQRIIAARVARGASIVGRKIGLTSEAVQRQVGVDQPDFGVLLDDMRFDDGDVIPTEVLLQPRAEVEVAFVLSADIDDDLDAERLRASVAYASPAIEVVDSRVRDWDIVITDTVADNASSGVFVLGGARLALDEFEPREVTMKLLRDGEEVSHGVGAACLGDPLSALAWLARTARVYGMPLKAGDIILSGALGPLASVQPGDSLQAAIEPLGTVNASFAKGASNGSH